MRRERLIAACRVPLALLSLLAVWIDPTEPTRLVGLAYWLLGLYVFFALGLAQWIWQARSTPPALPLLVHVVDLAVFALLIVVTAGPDSPFFPFLVFALVAATVRWQERGTLWTGAAALASFLVTGVAAERLDPVDSFEVNRFILRSIYLVVLAVLLGYVGYYERRLRERVAALGDWTPFASAPADADDALGALLEHATRVLQAPRAALAWEDEEEPWANLVVWSGSSLEWQRGAPGDFSPLAPEDLAERTFFVTEPDPDGGAHRVLTKDGVERRADDPLPPVLRERVGAASALSVPLQGESVTGRFFALDSPAMTSDEIVLGKILARQIALQMDRLSLFDRHQREALADERIRLASDVHDSVIQSLAGAALRLESARQLLAQDPAAAGRLIEECQDLLVSEQRELREFVGGLTLGERGPAGQAPLARQLEELSERIHRHWSLRVTVKGAESLEGLIDPRLARQLCRMIHEALVNASRHGRASAADVDLSLAGNEVRVTVSDDGRGFAFRGRYDSVTLTALKLGPLSLKRRIATLGGALDIVSTEKGARLEVRLPLVTTGG